MVVINNGGGRIFTKVPRLAGMSAVARSWMAAETPVDFGAVARAFGMDYLRVVRADEFDGVEENERAVLLEVVPG